jgi:hypothetical protein
VQGVSIPLSAESMSGNPEIGDAAAGRVARKNFFSHLLMSGNLKIGDAAAGRVARKFFFSTSWPDDDMAKFLILININN